jgi:hypothetical protein
MNANTRQYLETALWSSVNFKGEPLDDHYDIDDLPAAFVAEADELVDRFLDANRADLDALGLTDEQAAHCLWLTRERHGAGFIDHQGPAARRLVEAAHLEGEGYSDLLAALPECQCCADEPSRNDSKS